MYCFQQMNIYNNLAVAFEKVFEKHLKFKCVSN